LRTGLALDPVWILWKNTFHSKRCSRFCLEGLQVQLNIVLTVVLGMVTGFGVQCWTCLLWFWPIVLQSGMIKHKYCSFTWSQDIRFSSRKKEKKKSISLLKWWSVLSHRNKSNRDRALLLVDQEKLEGDG
jgi:hypothetical protein